MEHSEFTTRAMLKDFDTSDYATDYRDVTVSISKVGGGTLGQSYEGRWRYRVVPTNRPTMVIATGDDLNTGTPKTHVQAASDLLDFLGDWY